MTIPTPGDACDYRLCNSIYACRVLLYIQPRPKRVASYMYSGGDLPKINRIFIPYRKFLGLQYIIG